MSIEQTKNVAIHKMADGVSYEWDSYESFVPDMKQIAATYPTFMSNVVGTGGMSNVSWWGCADGFAGIQRRVENGWPELRTQLLKMLEGLDLELPVFPSMSTARRRKRRRDDHGDTLDIHRVWDGQLDKAWDRPMRTERMMPNTKRITVAFDVTANACVSNSQAMWRAALCTLLCDSLARAGRIFEIWVVDSTSNPFSAWGAGVPKRLWSAWCVKKTADPLVLDRICAMVSVGFMRSAGFTAMRAGPWPPSSGFGGALGSGLPHTLRQRREAGEVVLRIGECYSRQAVVAEYANAWREIETNMNDNTDEECDE